MIIEEELTKKNWPSGLWCVVCGKRIPFGRSVFWNEREAWCHPCIGKVRPGSTEQGWETR